MGIDEEEGRRHALSVPRKLRYFIKNDLVSKGIEYIKNIENYYKK